MSFNFNSNPNSNQNPVSGNESQKQTVKMYKQQIKSLEQELKDIAHENYLDKELVLNDIRELGKENKLL